MTTEIIFQQLLKEHIGILHKVSRLYADSPADREDLMQEIAYQLWKAFPSFRGDSKSGTWVYRVALNTALGRIRKRKPLISYRALVPEYGEPPEDDDSPMQRLFAAIRQLPKTDRALIALFFEDLSHDEIGRVLGVTENNVAVRLHRIKAKLKNLLNQN
ncbi:RNA polymerase sigma factor [Neolewinella persica]|uniref:RNA polymerase sigma factor n=1 Tax=Neolewinella persica TaxID=70998 RepID=UPI000376E933|nr:sigma-70 family RNA polymerase sigma factor [Neolewinella persica]